MPDRRLVDSVRPTRTEFRHMAREFTVVPVWLELMGDTLTPVGAFIRLCEGEDHAFLLESVEHGERWSRWSFLGRRPLGVVIARDGVVGTRGEALEGASAAGGMFATLEGILSRFRAPVSEDLPPLHGGLVGYLGYDVVREVERLPSPPAGGDLPDAEMAVIGELVAFDHLGQRITLIENVVLEPGSGDRELDALWESAVERLVGLARDCSRPSGERLVPPPRLAGEVPEVKVSVSSEDFGAAVEAAREYIASGDIFQVVLSKRFEFDLGADPFDYYRVLRQVNPSPYMFFVRQPEVTLVGCSPEPLVKVEGRRVISRPIAGTRRRGATEEEDRRLAAELVENPKERAEHVMLVDLARNDLGRVVAYGTERVDEMMTLERYSHVMHLTSQVSGDLKDGFGPVDVLRATLPAGTVSGAPKVRAMEIIDELEPQRRGPYAGVVGYIDFSGNLDTAIAIRTCVVEPDGRAWVQAGAGIVADSIPEHEDRECHNKARALLEAVCAARALTEAQERGGR
ncbi:MAG: anthranilate synthase component I [Acidimicrobiales bacterium]|nr:MAG: anthranilate synthase component I [Acidimicrobiales bacterium]